MLVRLTRAALPIAASMAVSLAGLPTASAAITARPTAVPPVQVPGARVVDLRDTSGGITRHMSIPSSSLFRRHGGVGAACNYVASASGSTSDGQRVERGQTVESQRWIFVEGLPESIGEPTPTNPNGQRGPLSNAVRWFTVFCDSTLHAVGLVAVSSRDPMLDPRGRIDDLRQGLRLARPVVYRNPVVDRWGGLITRYTTWLAVTPSAWTTQRSNALRWRGWTMYLFAEPVALDFQVDFTPAKDRPSTAFHGRVACVARGATFTRDVRSVPAMPTLPLQASPGVNGHCRWTPPGPGSVRIQARVTYRITFWANAYTESLADYVWSGTPSTFRVGELSAVNTRR